MMEKEIKEMFGLLLKRFDGIETRLDRLESRQDEIFLVVKAIEHNNLVHGAEIDNLKFKTSHIEGTINAVGNVITTRKAI
ncbi:M domain protein [Desulfosporosinus fructosivorans]